jgi:hypothetical protein
MVYDAARNIIFIHVFFHALTQITSVNFNMNLPIFYTPMTILIYIIVSKHMLAHRAYFAEFILCPVINTFHVIVNTVKDNK